MHIYSTHYLLIVIVTKDARQKLEIRVSAYVEFKSKVRTISEIQQFKFLAFTGAVNAMFVFFTVASNSLPGRLATLLLAFYSCLRNAFTSCHWK